MLLLNAKRAGLIRSVRERLDALRATGFWLKDEDYLTILDVSGEQGSH
jgi:predicted nucleic acid-binding protein